LAQPFVAHCIIALIAWRPLSNSNRFDFTFGPTEFHLIFLSIAPLIFHFLCYLNYQKNTK
jgi:hypothetical protein